MIVTSVRAITAKKYRVELDGQFVFALYKGELSRFSIREGETLSEETFDRIKSEVLLKRAKMRALHLLEAMGRTEAMLRARLKEDLYPDEIAEQAVGYVKSFGYINDGRYALDFISSRKASKSRREIRALLSGKGIAPDTLEEAFEEAYAGEGDRPAILAILKKKKFDAVMDDPGKKQKILGYLARKGFRYEDIRSAVREFQEKGPNL